MQTQLDRGQQLDDYEILSVAGSGGMGVVYRARQRSLDRVVAVKVIQDEIARMPEYRERFLREARLAASVDHPHIVSVYDVGEADDHLFLAMQWIDGEDLRKIMGWTGHLAPDRCVTVATQLAGALDTIHNVAGLVHRDVKPANVLIRQVGGSDHAYLTDFGVAKPNDARDHLTQTGSVVGTTGYLSPEQIRGAEPGPQSDLYALGCLLFEALTGRPPFRASNEMAIRWAHANDPRPLASEALPSLGSGYDDFFAAALAVDPAQRFASGREFAHALASAHAGEASVGSAPIVTPRTPTAVGPPTPLPPIANTPPPAYPGYAYQTPPPTYSQPPRSGSPLALIVLGLVAAVGIAVGALAASGVFSGHQSTTKTITTASAKTRQRSKIESKRPVHKQKIQVTPPTATVPPSARTSCGGDLSVGPATTCGFAANVEQAYNETGGGDQTVLASSPATGLTYTMHCTGGTEHVCTGGKNASVYFGSAGSTSGTATQSAPTTTPSGLKACDQNISANSATSCPFAENVFKSYAEDYRANGEQSANAVSAYSSATGRNYSMSCSNDGTTVTCSGGSDALVTFPMHAVVVY